MPGVFVLFAAAAWLAVAPTEAAGAAFHVRGRLIAAETGASVDGATVADPLDLVTTSSNPAGEFDLVLVRPGGRLLRISAAGRIPVLVPALAHGDLRIPRPRLHAWHAATTIGSQGTELIAQGAAVKLNLPAGAFPTSGPLSLQSFATLEDVPLSPRLGGVSAPYLPFAAAIAGPEGQVFAQPSQLRFANIALLPPGAAVVLLRLDRLRDQWVPNPHGTSIAQVSQDGNWIDATVTKAGAWMLVLPGQMNQASAHPYGLADITLKRGWGNVKKLEGELAVADARLLRFVTIRGTAAQQPLGFMPLRLLYDSGIAGGRGLMSAVWNGALATAPDWTRMAWQTPESAGTRLSAGLTGMNLFHLPVESTRSKPFLAHTLLDMTFGHPAQLGMVGSGGEPLGIPFQPTVMSPWHAEATASIGAAPYLAASAPGLAQGWTFAEVPALYPDADNPARHMYVVNGRAEYTSRQGRISRLLGGANGTMPTHGPVSYTHLTLPTKRIV